MVGMAGEAEAGLADFFVGNAEADSDLGAEGIQDTLDGEVAGAGAGTPGDLALDLDDLVGEDDSE